MTPVTGDDPPAIMDPDEIPVMLGTTTYQLRAVPFPRLKRLKKVWLAAASTLMTLLNQADLTNANAVDALFGVFEDHIPELVNIVVIGFNMDLFDDEDNGPTIPQLRRLFEAALQVNDLEDLRKAVPFVWGQVQEEQRANRYLKLKAAGVFDEPVTAAAVS